MANWRQRIAGFINPPATKTAGANWFLNFMKLAADEDSGDGITVDNAFSNVAWLNIVVSCRARNISRTSFELYDGDTEITSGPAFDLFNHGQAGKSRYQLWEETEGWRCLRGEAIWILGWGGQKGFPQQIVIVDPVNMVSKVDEATRQIVLWHYKTSKMDVPFKPEEVIHFPMWTPDDNYRGVNQIISIKDEVAQERQAARSGTKLLANNSIPGGVISIPGDTLSTQEAEAVIENWEKKHRGARNAGRIAVLGSGATYQRVSLTPTEMQSFEMRAWNRDTILAKYGVPHAVVGVARTGGTLAGKDTMEQMRAFWNLTLIPELKYFEDKLQHDFFDRFGLAMKGEFNTDDIDELQADADLLHTRLREDVKAGILTANEAREQLGMDPVEWGDIWWVPINLTPADIAQSNAESPPPAPAVTPSPQADQVNQQASFFPVEAKAKVYTPEYRAKHWEMVIKAWEGIEKGYAKAVKSWIFEIRQQHLHTLMENGFTQAIQHQVMDELTGEPMWNEYGKKLAGISKPFLTMAVEAAGEQLNSIFTDLGIISGSPWSIWDTRAKDMLEYRLNKGSLKDIPQTVRAELQAKLGDGIHYGWTESEMADSLRGVYNIVSNRAPTIARTEIGGAINDSRIAGFKDVGITQHEWLTAHDERVRDLHQIDGEVVEVGQKFSNGLRYPNDPDGDAANVINCRCISLPVFEGEARAVTAAPKVKQIETIPAIAASEIKTENTTINLNLTVEAAEKGPTRKSINIVRDANGELQKAEVLEVTDG